MFVQLNLDLVPIEMPPVEVVESALGELSAALTRRLVGADLSTARWIAESVLVIEQARVHLGERAP
jgi:hypothetical protein